VKSLVAYFVDFRGLGINNVLQFITAVDNPIFFTAFILLLAGFIKRARYFYPTVIIVYIALNVLLVVNVLYFREMTSFISFNTIAGYGKVSQGVGAASLSYFKPHDIIYFADVILGLIFFRKIKLDLKPIKRDYLRYLLSIAVLGVTSNYALASIDRPQLLTRGFDVNYYIKYLGINFYTVQDTIDSFNRDRLKSQAKPSDIDNIRAYIKKHFAPEDAKYFGVAKGKNVIYIHLESFQQFSIDAKINDQEVTPFINSIYHSKDAISFDNFYHEVGQGKTTDAETMLETSTFGLPTGSVFNRYYANQFQAMPAILDQDYGYSSAVFHGNNASFWNRSVMYKSLGYQNFFDASYFDVSGRKATTWGLKDKLLFKDSIPFLEKMSQPFYVKFLTVTNHTPFTLDSEDADPTFTGPNTNSPIVNGYFQTNRYLDNSVREFYDYLQKTGLDKKSIIVLYGDHYGISESEDKVAAQALGINTDNWNDFNDLQMQKVPFIIDMPGSNLGGIKDTFGGEIDAMPTLEHLLGIKTQKYVQFGQDLLSSKHEQQVIFRNKDWITPEYASIGENIYDTKTGTEIDLADLTSDQRKQIDKLSANADKKLGYSDELIYRDLLRFYTPSGFTPIKPQTFDYSYTATMNRLNDYGSTSIFAQNGNRSTSADYVTDAPEQNDPRTDSARITIQENDEVSSSSAESQSQSSSSQ
jgi:lipoteichoic acid synthase